MSDDAPTIVSTPHSPPKILRSHPNSLAKTLHEWGWFYAWFGLLDGASLSYSMIKYVMDLLYSPTQMSGGDVSDAMHNWLLTPEGIAIATIESVALIGFSLIANVVNDDTGCGFLEVANEAELKEKFPSFKRSYYILCGKECVFYYQKSCFIKSNTKPTLLALDKKEVDWFVENYSGKHFPEKLPESMLEAIAAKTKHQRPQYKMWRSLAAVWPYVRDVMKSLKNGYKGTRSALTLFQLMGLQTLKDCIWAPLGVGIVLGALSVFNRLWLRRVREKRKTLMQVTDDLLAEIKAKDEKDFDDGTVVAFQNKIDNKRQVLGARANHLAYLSAAYGGFIDGPYLYLGLFSLTASAIIPPAFIFLATISILYSVLLISARIYEERCYQRKLDLAIGKATLALLSKKIEYHCGRLEEPNALCSSYEWNRLSGILEDFEKERQKVDALKDMVSSYKQAMLAGISNGLFAYGVLASLAFAVGIIFTLASFSFPPLMLTIIISAGLACLTGFLAHAGYKHYRLQKAQQLAPRCNVLHLSFKPEKGEFDKISKLIGEEGGLVWYSNNGEEKLCYVDQKIPGLIFIDHNDPDFRSVREEIGKLDKDKAKVAGDSTSKFIKIHLHNRLDKRIKAIKDASHAAQTPEPIMLADTRVDVLVRMQLEPTTQFVFQEGFEVVRSAGAGLGKSNSMSSFMFNSLQRWQKDKNGNEHFQAPKLLALLSVVGGIFYGLVLGCRACARTFGKPTSNTESKKKELSESTVMISNALTGSSTAACDSPINGRGSVVSSSVSVPGTPGHKGFFKRIKRANSLPIMSGSLLLPPDLDKDQSLQHGRGIKFGV